MVKWWHSYYLIDSHLSPPAISYKREPVSHSHVGVSGGRARYVSSPVCRNLQLILMECQRCFLMCSLPLTICNLGSVIPILILELPCPVTVPLLLLRLLYVLRCRLLFKEFDVCISLSRYIDRQKTGRNILSPWRPAVTLRLNSKPIERSEDPITIFLADVGKTCRPDDGK
jgi:hypothetical protein